MDCGFFAYQFSWGCNFMEATAFNFSKKTNFFKVYFFRGCRLSMNTMKIEQPGILMIPEYVTGKKFFHKDSINSFLNNKSDTG